MPTLPRVSVCIPTYCQIDYLRETLLSVESQNYENYELIISDDSPDESIVRLLESFSFGRKLRYFHNPIPLGSPENWNQAVRQAKGDYIKILHHDDRFSHPNALNSFVRLLDENPGVDFAFCASTVENINNGKRRVHRPTPNQLSNLSLFPENLFFGNFIGAPSATIYRNGLTVKYDSKMKWLVDVDFYINTLIQNINFAYTPEALIITPTNAVHQVSEICKNSGTIEFFESALLYSKHSSKLKSNVKIIFFWFSLFEKYRVFSQKDLVNLDHKLKECEDVLEEFFCYYHNVRFLRIPTRVFKASLKYFRSVARKLI